MYLVDKRSKFFYTDIYFQASRGVLTFFNYFIDYLKIAKKINYYCSSLPHNLKRVNCCNDVIMCTQSHTFWWPFTLHWDACVHWDEMLTIIIFKDDKNLRCMWWISRKQYYRAHGEAEKLWVYVAILKETQSALGYHLLFNLHTVAFPNIFLFNDRL